MRLNRVKTNVAGHKKFCETVCNKINDSPVGREEVVVLSAKNGATADENGRTALHFAVDKGDFRIVNKRSVVWIVSIGNYLGYEKIIDTLVHYNTNASIKDHNEMSPIDVASGKGIYYNDYNYLVKLHKQNVENSLNHHQVLRIVNSENT